MVSIQIMGPFASSAFVMCLEVETLDSVLCLCRETRVSDVTASLGMFVTQTSVALGESGILSEHIPQGAKLAGAAPWLPRKFADAALLSATATHCSAVSAGLELRSTHSGKAEMQPGSAAPRARRGWYLQNPGSALQPPQPPPRYLSSAPPFPPGWGTKTDQNCG